MQKRPSKFLETHRVLEGPLASDRSSGNNGAFDILYNDALLGVIAACGRGWDHVNVHTLVPFRGNYAEYMRRTPTWDEMDYVRKLFFRGDEWVIQYHPPASKYINKHSHTLHMWRPQDEAVPTPPAWMV